MTDIPQGSPAERATTISLPKGATWWEWLFSPRDEPEPRWHISGPGRTGPCIEVERGRER